MVRNLGRHGIKVPRLGRDRERLSYFIASNDLERLIASQLASLENGAASIAEVGSAIRSAIEGSEWPDDLAEAVCSATGICRDAWEQMRPR